MADVYAAPYGGPQRTIGRFVERLYRIGTVSPLVMLLLVPFALSSITLGCVTAHQFAKSTSDVLPAKAAVALYVSAGLQFVLGFALLVRGTVTTTLFKGVFAQMVLTAHALLPAFIVTSLWAARLMIDATVLQMANYNRIFAADVNVVASSSLLTATMVFSNLYTACTIAILYANSAHFLKDGDEN
jgi:hypothetical protein